MKYYEYIRSEAWQRKRKEFYSSKMYKQLRGSGKWSCYCCARSDISLDLHHRTYKRLGNENIAIDLIPVCRECHTKIHEYEKSGVQLWSATKKVRNQFVRKEKKKARKIKNKIVVDKTTFYMVG